MQKKLVFITLFTAIIVVGCRDPEQREAKVSGCLVNLQQIEECKISWAGDNLKEKSSIPNWDDLRPYFPARWSNNIPICPAGGVYTVNAVRDLPTCSVGRKGHTLHFGP